jgi:gluconate 2-dehydrogenase gamma chain
MDSHDPDHGPSAETPSAVTSERAADGALDRRQFLSDAAGVAGVATVTWFWLEGLGKPWRRRDVEPSVPGAPKTFDGAQWRTLEAACERLLPTGPDSPGASTVNAVGYLDAVLAEDFVDDDTRTLILDGAATLDKRARAGGKAREFVRLQPSEQDEAIRVFETHRDADGSFPGHEWLKTMLGFIFEAFFGDPVHGGNPQEIAWKWAGHRPGFPRPTQPGWRMVERE